MKTSLFLLITLLPALFPSLSFAQWTQTNGPEGGDFEALYRMNSTIYAGTYQNGVYASGDDGLNWSPRNYGIEDKQVLSITSNSSGILFAGTAGYGIYHSSDNGQSWLPSSTGTNLYVISLQAMDNYIFAGSVNDGVYRSSDDGVTWTQTSFWFNFVTGLGLGTDRIIASTIAYTLYSTDYGDTWQEIISLESKSPNTFYTDGNFVIAGGTNEVYRSTDGGQSFTTVSVYFPVNTDFFQIIGSGTDLYMATSYDGVYKSTNQGNIWMPFNTDMGGKDVRSLTVTNSSTLLAGTHYAGLYRSTIGSAGWNKSMAGLPPGALISAYISTDSSLFAGTRDGVYKTTDNGSEWTKLSGNDTVDYALIRGLCMFNGNLYAGTIYQYNGAVYKSTDNGASWLRKTNGLPSNLIFVNGLAVRGNNIVAATGNGIYYSTDEGDSWHQAASVPVDYVESMAEGGGFVYALIQTSGIYRSTDGINWVHNANVSGKVVKLETSGSALYVGTFFNGAFYSFDYGSNFYPCSGFPSGASVFALGAIGNGMVLAGSDLYPDNIHISYNNGVDFTPYSEGLSAHTPVEYFAANDTFMFALSDYNGVWRRYLPGITPVELSSFTAAVSGNDVMLKWSTSSETNNKGFEIERSRISGTSTEAEWKKIGFVEGNGTSSESHTYTSRDDNVQAGRYEYRLKQADFDGGYGYSELAEAEILSPAKFSLAQNYPNPFNPSTEIGFTLPEDAGNVRLTVYNTLGQKVTELVNSPLTAGTYRYSWNARNEAAGVYLYEIKADGFVSVKKMILLK